MLKGHKKKPIYPRVCYYCNVDFLGRDVKSSICDNCRIEVSEPCACGCGKIITKSKAEFQLYPYFHRHDLRGKTLKEIYGTSDYICGYKRGDDNVAKRPEVREKIRQFIAKGDISKRKYFNSIGEKFRSPLEVQFSELMLSNAISYKYEKSFRLNNGHYKLVDFLIDDEIIVEISGYAYDGWRFKFIQQMEQLRKSTDNQILILTYPKNRSSELIPIPSDSIRNIWSTICGPDMYTGDIYNEEYILKQIKFCKRLINMKEIYAANYEKTQV